MKHTELLKILNGGEKKDERLNALCDIKKKIETGEIKKPTPANNINNHIHTIYSFSPYSPAGAVFAAYMSGLATAGIMDHDSLAGAAEFAEAGKILGIATTVGVELRVDMKDTKLNGRRINNTDQDSVAYTAIHGIPPQNIDMVQGWLAPFRKNRNTRNIKMCENITDIMKPYGIRLDFYEHVLPGSQYKNGGTVTERHICYALAELLCEKYPAPGGLLNFFSSDTKINISKKTKQALLENNPGYYLYDVLGLIKAELIGQFYVEAYDECPHVEDYIKTVTAAGAFAAYPYLGDVGESVTGDKRPQKFEDDYIELLFEEITRLGFTAVTYMPVRNTKAQLERVIELCGKHNLFQICGEDINSPRQEFVCEKLKEPMFAHLIDAAWALIEHEKNSAEILLC
ncbi:MAG: PHP domain-containing protein [Oscillospiraceae bacterium]|nr:PHP domain-containing protein [Oscillospiraceae bacterium]